LPEVEEEQRVGDGKRGESFAAEGLPEGNYHSLLSSSLFIPTGRLVFPTPSHQKWLYFDDGIGSLGRGPINKGVDVAVFRLRDRFTMN
jgi:hypothetical protein